MSTAVLVAGLGFGDEGKGTTVDYLCAKRNASLVVRYNGGAQAAHNVVTPDGKHHTFSQIGAGFFQGASTYLSRFVLVDLLALMAEARHLAVLGYAGALRSVYVDGQATIITPYHRVANRIRETLRGEGRHGSCGVGVGEARSDEIEGVSLKFRDTVNLSDTEEVLKEIQDKKLKEFKSHKNNSAIHPDDWGLLSTGARGVAETYQRLYNEVPLAYEDFFHRAIYRENVVFEGAQGVLLDETYGFYPYNSWTNTTFENAETLLKEVGFHGIVERCGVLRTYMTRHGAGPFVTENKEWMLTSKEHNVEGPWQGAFRAGPLDLIALRYAIDVCGGVDYLCLTHHDELRKSMCTSYFGYEQESCKFFKKDGWLVTAKREPKDMEELTKALFTAKPHFDYYDQERMEKALMAKVLIKSYGPTCRNKVELR